MVSLAEIESLATQIAKECDPERIILFGSYAYGTQHPDSDVDLLVVLSHGGRNWRKAAEIRSRGKSRFPVDLLVRAPWEVSRRIAEGDPFLREIVQRGRILHARNHE